MMRRSPCGYSVISRSTPAVSFERGLLPVRPVPAPITLTAGTAGSRSRSQRAIIGSVLAKQLGWADGPRLRRAAPRSRRRHRHRRRCDLGDVLLVVLMVMAYL